MITWKGIWEYFGQNGHQEPGKSVPLVCPAVQSCLQRSPISREELRRDQPGRPGACQERDGKPLSHPPSYQWGIKIVYHFWSSIVFLSVPPIVVLIFTHGSIVRSILHTLKDLASFRTLSQIYQKATMTLFVIVSVFLVCHTPVIFWIFLQHLAHNHSFGSWT